MKKTEAEQVGDIIRRYIAMSGNQDAFDRGKVCYLWPEVVGPGVNRYTVRRWVDGDTLHVVISSASLKNELMFLKSALVEKLNAAAGANIINNIAIH